MFDLIIFWNAIAMGVFSEGQITNPTSKFIPFHPGKSSIIAPSTSIVGAESQLMNFNVAPNLKREVSWAINGRLCAKPALEDGTVLTEGQKSRGRYWAGLAHP
jgi:hypothetical protein